MADYFVIDGRDGSPYVAQITKKELEQGLMDGRFGTEFIHAIENYSQEICYFGDDRVLIIKGTVLIPKAQEAVTVWDIG